jgi:hypothetical protein
MHIRIPKLMRNSITLPCTIIALSPIVHDLYQWAIQGSSPISQSLWTVAAEESSPFTETPEQLLKELNDNFQEAENKLANNDFRAVRRLASLIDLKIEKHGKKLERGEKKTLKNRLATLNGSMKRKVDSLVTINLTIIERNGTRAGNEFRQQLSSAMGVSETDLASVDQAIVERSNFETDEGRSNSYPVQTSAPEPPPTKEQAPESIPTPKPTVQPPAPPHPQITSIPEPQPAARPDTVPVYKPTNYPAMENKPVPVFEPTAAAPSQPAQAEFETEKSGIQATEQAAKIRSLIDARKIEEAGTVFHIYQIQLQRSLDPDSYKNLLKAVDDAVAQDQQRQASASQKVKEIEQLLEANRTSEAFVALNKAHDSLARAIDKNDLRALEKKVNQAYVGFVKTQLAANVTKRSIQTMLSENDVENAYATFEKRNEELKRGLPLDGYESLRKEVVSANNAILDKKKRSEFLYKDITSLINASDGAAAAALFAENNQLLSQYLETTRYSTLSSEVEKARLAFLARQKKAQELAASIDSLVSSAREKEAHSLFEVTKNGLRKDLADDKRFFALRDRQSEAYTVLVKKERSALRTAKEIEYLIRNREGRKAYDLFKQEETVLGKYIARDVVAKLASEALRANNDYLAQCETARSTAAYIETLLNKGSVEQAYAGFKKAESDFDFYLEGDAAIEVLRKKVTQAYKALQERKQWSASQVKQIRRLIKRHRGNQAFELFNSTRSELVNYVDEKSLAALGKEVSRANLDYAKEVDKARQDADRIRSLLAQNRIEDAYNSFSSLEANLRLYCTLDEFENIKRQVEGSNSALQGKKREALRTLKNIDGLIDRKWGDSAYNTFYQNNDLLSSFLSTDTYKGAADRVEVAKNDFQKNGKKAQNLETSLWDLLREDRTLAASEKFDEQRAFLEHYLGNSGFTRLKTSVGASYNAFMVERKKAQAIVVTLRRMIKQFKGVEAQAEFYSNQRTFERYLPQDEYLEMVAMVEKAYNGTLQGRKEANETADAIRNLIANDEMLFAYSTFKEMKPTLERYTSEKDFTALETEVEYAREEYGKKVKQAKEYAKELKQLIGDKNPGAAYKGFRSHRRELEKYLDAQTFSDLEAAVREAYNKSGVKSRTNG